MPHGTRAVRQQRLYSRFDRRCRQAPRRVGSQASWRTSALRERGRPKLAVLAATSPLAEWDELVSLVGIEEPEPAFQPAASGAWMNAPGENGRAHPSRGDDPQRGAARRPRTQDPLSFPPARRGNVVIGPRFATRSERTCSYRRRAAGVDAMSSGSPLTGLSQRMSDSRGDGGEPIRRRCPSAL